MRSHRFQKSSKVRKAAAFSNDTTVLVAKYEEMTPVLSASSMVPLETFIGGLGPDSLKGVTKVSEFSEDLKYKRRYHMKNYDKDNVRNNSFGLMLYYEDGTEMVSAEYMKGLIVTFKYTKPGDDIVEKAAISYYTKSDGNDNIYTVDDLDLDSDITEYLFRFTRGLSWGSETVAILDCNPDQAVEKGIYLTLNAPFNCNIKWGMNKRKLIKGYAFLDS